MTELTEGAEKKTPQAQDILDPRKLFRSIDKVRKEAPPLEPLWGYFLFKKAITSIVGDPGVCKTTWGYGLAKSLCLGKTFLDVPSEEPVNVLYMDFESADSLVASRANLVIGDIKLPNFTIYNEPAYYLPQVAKITLDFCKENDINLLIIDNQSMAFNTRDENDNAEAIKQMRFLRSLAVACNVSMISFHHTSKANLTGTRKGTGAYARARLADICINIEAPDETDEDVIRLEVSKNRLVSEKVTWYFRKTEGEFVFTDPPLGVTGQPTGTLIYKAQYDILQFMEQQKEYTIAEITAKVGINGLNYNVIDKALRRLVQHGRIHKPRHGYYIKTHVNQPYSGHRNTQKN